MNIVAPVQGVLQPPVLSKPDDFELHVAISSLSLGGAEKIVVDWASRIYPQWKVHLIVLRDREKEWPVPAFIRMTRLHGVRFAEQLKVVGKDIATSPNPICVCHLLREEDRNALAEAGVFVVPVLHNAKDGWLEGVSGIKNSPYVVAVSQACNEDLKKAGWNKPVSIIRHIPPITRFSADAREQFRRSWNVPQNAEVIGMIGAVKPQKNYFLALRVLKELLKKKDVFLVIVGGPVNTSEGRSTWKGVVDEICRLGLRHRVAMPGFIPHAASCFPAFDLALNTSRYEGLSIATLEALMSGLPVVASRVGGQGELGHDGLILMSKDATEDEWVLEIERVLGKKFNIPEWSNFPSHRLWTLAGLAGLVKKSAKTLFVTANLNAGGAQRSLVNLSKSLVKKMDFEIVVAGRSTHEHFYEELKAAGVKVWRTGERWNAFSYAEEIVQKICADGINSVYFWNVDARIKLLIVKALNFTSVKFIEVSPGDYIFDEINNAQEFQKLISFDSEEYFARLSAFVSKYRRGFPARYAGKAEVIRNGVPAPEKIKKNYSIEGSPRIAVCGRIAPAKFTKEIIEAMRFVWKKIPNAELHVFGAAEHYHAEYAQSVLELVGEESGKRIFFRGFNFEAVKILPDFDAFIVLGKNQGCPNALLEALSVGLPAVANDDGGTGEQLIHDKTGLLIKNTDPEEIASALARIILDRDLAKRLGEKGREHVIKNFSMEEMIDRYLEILSGVEAQFRANLTARRNPDAA